VSASLSHRWWRPCSMPCRLEYVGMAILILTLLFPRSQQPHSTSTNKTGGPAERGPGLWITAPRDSSLLLGDRVVVRFDVRPELSASISRFEIRVGGEGALAIAPDVRDVTLQGVEPGTHVVEVAAILRGGKLAGWKA
jgi:hypothetical protein